MRSKILAAVAALVVVLGGSVAASAAAPAHTRSTRCRTTTTTPSTSTTRRDRPDFRLTGGAGAARLPAPRHRTSKVEVGAEPGGQSWLAAVALAPPPQ